MKHNNQMQFLRLPEVLRRVGLSKAQLYKLIAQDQFPSQIKICRRLSVWLEADVIQWMQEQIVRHEGGSALIDGKGGSAAATQWLREMG